MLKPILGLMAALTLAGAAAAQTPADPNRLFADSKIVVRDRFSDEIVGKGPDLILIPIGGGPFVMNPVDAAMATRDLIKPKMALPIHYGTTPQLSGTPQEFINALGSAPVKVLAIQPGEALIF